MINLINKELLDPEHVFHSAHICLMNLPHLGKISLPFGGLFGQDMAFEGMLPSDLAGSGKLEPLLCT